MNTAFCPICMKDVDVRIEDRRERLLVRDEEVEVATRVAVCTTCAESLWTDELEDKTLAAAFTEYRRRHGLLQPGEMACVRGQWGLGQRAFALLLGWGEITLHRYESGSLQDKAHDAQLRMADHADNVRILLKSNGDRLTPRQRAAVERRLRKVEATASEEECGDEDFERLLAKESKGAYGGDVPLSLSKVREMILYFSESPNMFVTKLAKLMFYADFLHYKEHTTSITGLAYAHLTHGPVPEYYERIRADALENSIVQIEERCGDDWAGEVLVAQRKPDLDVFSESESAAMQAVCDQLGPMSSKRVSELSHAEIAYLSTSMGRRIPYDAAQKLSLSLNSE